MKDATQLHIRPARPEEAGLFYTPHPEEDKRLGTVGHVRMDFGRSGNEFWHTWWPRGPEELNSPAFKAELQQVVDTLRESVLKNRFAMERFCYEHGGKISGGWTQNYGYIVETEHYRYCLRCNPSPGDYNCYCTAYAAYHVTERGQEWYFKTSPGEELLTVGKKLRSYITGEKAAVPDLFIKMFAGGRPITAEEYNALTAVRMENTGKVRGVFDVNFDKREFSAVHIMDGWQTWAMRDVSVASYHATRSYFASADEQWRKLLDHLKGKEITSAGHLSAQNFSFGEEIIELDGKLNFYLQADFDVDAAFGTFVCADQNDDWLNIYANYDVEQERLCDTLELNLCKGDGSEESWSYPLNAAEQEVLLRKMEAFCQQQTGMSLHEYARQLRDSEKQAPEMQM